jgi:hypothetical protein
MRAAVITRQASFRELDSNQRARGSKPRRDACQPTPDRGAFPRCRPGRASHTKGDPGAGPEGTPAGPGLDPQLPGKDSNLDLRDPESRVLPVRPPGIDNNVGTLFETPRSCRRVRAARFELAHTRGLSSRSLPLDYARKIEIGYTLVLRAGRPSSSPSSATARVHQANHHVGRSRAPPGPRTLNPRIKSPLHVHLCLRRMYIGLAGIRPASSRPRAGRVCNWPTACQSGRQSGRQESNLHVVGGSHVPEPFGHARMVVPRGLEPRAC